VSTSKYISEYLETLTDETWQKEVLASPIPVAVDFFSDECPPCEALAPKYGALADLWHEDVRFVKILRQKLEKKSIIFNRCF